MRAVDLPEARKPIRPQMIRNKRLWGGWQHNNKGLIHGCYLCFTPKESMNKIANQMRPSSSSYTGLTCYLLKIKERPK